jgi:hypothetical protein
MPQLVYERRSTGIIFASTGQTVTLTFTSLANNAGRISSQWDRWSGSSSAIAVPGEVSGYCTVKLAVAAAIGAILTVYAVPSNAGQVAGNFGTTDAAVASKDLFRNAIPIGVVVAHAATVGPFTGTLSLFRATDRYLQIGIFNEMGQALTGTAADHGAWLYPTSPELQDAT